MELVVNEDIFLNSFNPTNCYSMISIGNSSIFKSIISSSKVTNVNFYTDKHRLSTIYLNYKNTRDPSYSKLDDRKIEYLVIDACDKRIQYLWIKDNFFIKSILEDLNLYNITLILCLHKDVNLHFLTEFERSFDFILNQNGNCIINKNFNFFDIDLIKDNLIKFYFSSIYKLTPLSKDLITYIILDYLDG